MAKKAIKGINDEKFKEIKSAIKKLEDLPDATKMGIIYDPQVGLDWATAHKIVEKLRKIFPERKCFYTGSYLREAKVVNDIDIVYIGKLDKLLVCLADTAFKITSRGDTKITCIFVNNIANCNIDIWLANTENKIPMILYTTGSKNFNVIMRGVAKKRGFLLNQNGLYGADGERVKITTEKGYFDVIGMRYLKPTERNL
jgi:DNA polymerase/3'-5' exonuclease PolX